MSRKIVAAAFVAAGSVALAVIALAVPAAHAQAKRSVAERVALNSPYAIKADDEEDKFVTATAEKAYTQHCASCHGADMHGKVGVPDLGDYDFLWGVTLEETSEVGPVMEIEQTILYGVRNQDCPDVTSQAQYGDCPDTRYSEMPAFAEIGALNNDQIKDLTEYVLSLSKQKVDEAAAGRGKELFPACTECHGADGRGYKNYGGPDLGDTVWLYGGDRAAIAESIAKGRMGRCPAWVHTLDEATIKSLAVYIWRKVGEG